MEINGLEITPIRDFILRKAAENTKQLTQEVCHQFNVSRQAVARHLSLLIAHGLIEAEGARKIRRYRLKPLYNHLFEIEIFSGLGEDSIWRHRVLPGLKNLPPNILQICEYGFTEILNNAIDHSASKTAIICCDIDYLRVTLTIEDSGIGIFRKIQKAHGLADEREALFELSKGKLTSDPQNHMGEGIFFTSRMFDFFAISSWGLVYGRKHDSIEALFSEAYVSKKFEGTRVVMEIALHSPRLKTDVFAAYQTPGKIGFRKTHIPVKMGKLEEDQLVSRSQAKRILSRFEKFSELMLDFEGVDFIGQAFADEVFRVFRNNHPEINVSWVNASEPVQAMIDYVKHNAPA